MKGRTRRAGRDATLAGLSARFEGVPRVAVYCGEGASHSWIWFADLLENLELYDARFVSHEDILARVLDSTDFLLVGGGDTYAMAESIGHLGASAIEGFVRSGGFYHGSCAGAYLVLRGVDLEPFTPFDLVDADMLNFMSDPPEPRCLAHKYLAPYGDGWVFHPVYGEVELSPCGAARDMAAFRDDSVISAPLFGGPVLSVPDPEKRLADYAGASSRAAFLWPRDQAERFIARRQAVALDRVGLGTVLASGPHLEHPLFPGSNALMAEVMADHWDRAVAIRPPAPRRAEGAARHRDGAAAPEKSLLEIKRQVSNARIVGFGLEKTPVTWKIGVKVWEPEKIRMFLDCAWDRIPYIETKVSSGECDAAAELEELAAGYGEATALAKKLGLAVQSEQDSQAEALSLLTRLKELTASFLSLYLTLRLDEQQRKSQEHRRNGADG